VRFPALFDLYTADGSRRDKDKMMIKFEDDASLSGVIKEDDSSCRDPSRT